MKNLTFGDEQGVFQLDVAKVVKVRQATREIIGSFKRNDMRVRGKLARKYWKRMNDRTAQILHAATNFVTATAARNGAAQRSRSKI